MNNIRFQFISTVLSSDQESQKKVDYIHGALDALLQSTETRPSAEILSKRIVFLSQMPNLNPENNVLKSIVTLGVSYAYTKLYDQKRAEELSNKRNRLIDIYLKEMLHSVEPARLPELHALTKIFIYLNNEHIETLLFFALENDITLLITQCRALYTPTLKKWQCALESGNHNFIQQCIENGTDVNMPFSNGVTALDWAVRKNPLDVRLIHILATAGANPNHLGIFKDSETLLIWLIKNDQSQTALAFIPRFTRALLDWQDNNGKTALRWAVEKNQYNLVVALTEAGAHRDLTNPLIGAIARKYENIALFLATANQNYPHLPKANLNIQTQERDTPLTFAAWLGQVQVVSALLEAPEIQLDAQDKDNATALVCAILCKSAERSQEVALHLIEKMKTHTRFFHLETNNGHTAFTQALFARKTPILLALLDCGVNPNRKNSQGFNALMFAIQHNQEGAVQDLLLNEEISESLKQKNILIDLNEQDSSGDTPLMRAAASKSAHLHRFFFTAEAFHNEMQMNYNLRNNQGETALHIAIKMHKTDLALRLIKGMNLSGERALATQILKVAALHNEDSIIEAIGRELYASAPPSYAGLAGEDLFLPPYIGDSESPCVDSNNKAHEHKEE